MPNSGNIATISGNLLTDSGIDLSTKADLVGGLVPSSQLPSYVDDVLEYANLAAFPATGETGKIYVALDSNKIYRWSGSIYVEISSGATWGGITGTLSNQTDLQNALNAKEPTISAGTTAQYYRGDKTFQTLNTAAVAESVTNLYYTDARARAALSFTAGSGAYNSSTGVITIPTNTNQLTNGAGFITGYTEIDTLASVTARGNSTTAGILVNGDISFNAVSGRGIFWGLNTDGGFVRYISTGNQAGASYLEIGTTDDLDEQIIFTQSGTTRVKIHTDGHLKNGSNQFYVYENGATWGINVSGTSGSISGFNNPTTAATPNTIAYRDASGDITVRELVLNVAVQDFTPSSMVAIYPTTNQAVKVTAAGARNFLDVPTRTGGNASGTWGINVTGSSGSAGVASFVNGTSGGAIQSWDVRAISPSTMSSYRLGFGFTSWANNNSAPYADYLHLRSYSDASGGSDNLVMFLKSGIGMRIWQQSFGSGTNYSSFVDVLHSSNYTSYSPTLTGGGASGTWSISITGNANNITQYTINQSVGTGNSPTFAQLYNNGWFRNNTNNTGLYNENTTQHLSSNTNGYWDVSSTTVAASGIVGIRLYAGGHVNTLRGYLYSDGSGFGLLNNQGGWSVICYQGVSYGGELRGAWNVTGAATFSSNVTVNGVYYVPNTSYFLSGTNGYRFNNSADTFNNFIVYDNGNAYVRGSVGIGVPSPQNALDVVRGAAGVMGRGTYESASFSYDADMKLGLYSSAAAGSAAASLIFGVTNFTAGSYYPGFELQFAPSATLASNYMRFNYIGRNSTGTVITSTTNILSIFQTGSVIVGGNADAGFKLDVQGTIRATGDLTITAANDTATGGGQIYINGANGNRIDFGAAGAAAPAFTTRSAGTKLVLYPELGAAAVDYALGIENNAMWYSVPVAGAARFFKWYGGTTNIATLDSSGKLTVANDVVAYGTPSDANLKTIKEVIPNALESIKKLTGYRFDWKNPDGVLNLKEDIGVIAQEVAAVLPELARTNGDGFMSVRYQGLTAVLIEAVKEQQAQIEDLKKQIDYLVENR